MPNNTMPKQKRDCAKSLKKEVERLRQIVDKLTPPVVKFVTCKFCSKSNIAIQTCYICGEKGCCVCVQTYTFGIKGKSYSKNICRKCILAIYKSKKIKNQLLKIKQIQSKYFKDNAILRDNLNIMIIDSIQKKRIERDEK